MSELLIRVVDKTSSDFYINAQCTKRGDVIVAKPDGWAWSVQELRNPQWIILKTRLSLEDVEPYLKSQRIDPLSSRLTAARRALKVDIDSLLVPANLRTEINNASRTSPRVDIGSFDINTIRVVKPIVADPNPAVRP